MNTPPRPPGQPARQQQPQPAQLAQPPKSSAQHITESMGPPRFSDPEAKRHTQLPVTEQFRPVSPKLVNAKYWGLIPGAIIVLVVFALYFGIGMWLDLMTQWWFLLLGLFMALLFVLPLMLSCS